MASFFPVFYDGLEKARDHAESRESTLFGMGNCAVRIAIVYYQSLSIYLRSSFLFSWIYEPYKTLDVLTNMVYVQAEMQLAFSYIFTVFDMPYSSPSQSIDTPPFRVPH